MQFGEGRRLASSPGWCHYEGVPEREGDVRPPPEEDLGVEAAQFIIYWEIQSFCGTSEHLLLVEIFSTQ